MKKILPHILALIFLVPLIQSCTTHKKIYQVRLLPSQTPIQNEENSYLSKSIYHFESGQFDAAMVCLHKAYSVDTANSDVFYYYGQIYKETGDIIQAGTSLNKALYYCSQDNTKRAEIYLALAELELIQGDISKAKQNYLTALQLQPDSKNARDALLKLNADF